MSEVKNHDKDNAAMVIAIIILILIFLFAIKYWMQPIYTRENYSTIWLDADIDKNYINPYIANYYSNNWPYYDNYGSYYDPYRSWDYDRHRH